MASSLSNLVHNLSEVIHKIKRKYGHNHKKCETFGINCKYTDNFFENLDFKNNLIKYKCLCCNKNYQKKFDGNLKKRFFQTNFLTMISISLFYCCKSVFTLMNL